MKFLDQGFQKLEDKRIRTTQTDRWEQMHYRATFAGGKVQYKYW